MGMFLYSSLLALGLAAAAPWWLWRMATQGRYRTGLRQRLGQIPADVLEAVAGRHVVWVHAVSVGEVLAAERLVGELEAALAAKPGAGWTVVVSTTTASGQRIARTRFGAERVFLFPLDFAFAVRAVLCALKPSLVVLVESELWPRLLDECARAGVPVAVANARLSDRSFRRAMRARRLWMRLFGSVRLFLPQGAETAERLLQLGVRPQRIVAAGNLKYDRLAPGPNPTGPNTTGPNASGPNTTAQWIRALAAGRPVLVAGSTLDRVRRGGLSEDEMVVQAWKGTLRAAGVLLVLAPRKPERFAEVAALAAEFRAVRASARQALPDAAVEVVVLDTLGDLGTVYAVASVAFLGGSLVPRGGHNPLEAVRFGVPVVMGESYANFREIVAGLRADEAIRIVRAEDLGETLGALLKDDGGQGERGRRFFEAQAGATGRTVGACLALLAERGA